MIKAIRLILFIHLIMPTHGLAHDLIKYDFISDTFSICCEDSIKIGPSILYDSNWWSNGVSEDSIFVSQPGWFVSYGQNFGDSLIYTDSIFITKCIFPNIEKYICESSLPLTVEQLGLSDSSEFTVQGMPVTVLQTDLLEVNKDLAISYIAY